MNVSAEVDMVCMVVRVFGMVRFAVDVMLVDSSAFVGKTLMMQSMPRISIAAGKVHEDMTTRGDCSMYAADVHEEEIVDYNVLEEMYTVAAAVVELTIRPGHLREITFNGG